MAKTGKRNPQDATLRNIRALKTRVLALEQRTRALERAVNGLMKVVAVLAKRVAKRVAESGMNTLHYGRPLKVTVAGGKLTIEIGIDVLSYAVVHSDWANPWDDGRNDYIRTFSIMNPEFFAGDVKAAMLREQEDGSSPLSNFLDSVTKDAVDDGTVACEYEQCIPHGKTSPDETWAYPNK